MFSLEMRNAYRILVGSPKRKFRKPVGRQVKIIKMDLRKINSKGMLWVHVAQDRDRRGTPVKTVTKLRVP
jgi:hypothetical protein